MTILTAKQIRDSMYWHCGYWDGPLSGLCFHDGELCRFECAEHGGWDGEEGAEHYVERTYRVIPLTRWERFRWLLRKRVFEMCVGYHCTYPHRYGGVGFVRGRWGWLSRLLFVGYYRARGSKVGWWMLWR